MKSILEYLIKNHIKSISIGILPEELLNSSKTNPIVYKGIDIHNDSDPTMKLTKETAQKAIEILSDLHSRFSDKNIFSKIDCCCIHKSLHMYFYSNTLNTIAYLICKPEESKIIYKQVYNTTKEKLITKENFYKLLKL